MRSNGSSKISGAAIAPMAALASLVPRGKPREMNMMTTKTTTTALKVTGATGLLGAVASAPYTSTYCLA
jgi:hypothetical protein